MRHIGLGFGARGSDVRLVPVFVVEGHVVWDVAQVKDIC